MFERSTVDGLCFEDAETEGRFAFLTEFLRRCIGL